MDVNLARNVTLMVQNRDRRLRATQAPSLLLKANLVIHTEVLSLNRGPSRKEARIQREDRKGLSIKKLTNLVAIVSLKVESILRRRRR